MKSPMLIAILHIRSGLKRNNKCCKDFIFPDSVVKEIGKNDIYKSDAETESLLVDSDEVFSNELII